MIWPLLGVGTSAINWWLQRTKVVRYGRVSMETQKSYYSLQEPIKSEPKHWDCNPVLLYLESMCKALGLIPSTTLKKQKNLNPSPSCSSLLHSCFFPVIPASLKISHIRQTPASGVCSSFLCLEHSPLPSRHTPSLPSSLAEMSP